MKKQRPIAKKIIVTLLICLPVFTLLFWERNSPVEAKTEDIYKSLETFSNVLSLVEKNYVHPKTAQEASPSPEEIKMRLRGIKTR